MFTNKKRKGEGPLKEQPLLKVQGLSKVYGNGCPSCLAQQQRVKNFCPSCGTVFACQDLSLEVYPGETIGIVGESGSGKSTFLKCLYFDESVTAGDMRLTSVAEPLNLFELPRVVQRKIRNEQLGMIYQNPMLGLRMDFSSISNIAEKMIAANERNVGHMEKKGKELLHRVNIPIERMKVAPRYFSGGMQQRVQIAKALSNEPPLLLLDEITTGLDLSVQASVLDLIRQIQRETQCGMIVVSHDLGVIRMLADRTVVMLDGKMIEQGLTDQLLENPQHAYTQQLVYSLL